MPKTEETWMDGKKIREAICKFKVGINAKREKIKHNKVFFPKQDNSQLEEDINIYETAIKALEKQLPKKVIDKSLVKDNDIVVGAVGRCPCCNEIIDDAVIVCDCNQKIDWSE